MKPILFNTEMVRSILDGRKTVTRRCIKGLHKNAKFIGWKMDTGNKYAYSVATFAHNGFTTEYTPKYHINEILYVRETFGYQIRHGGKFITYKADGGLYNYDCSKTGSVATSIIKWKPSIHMPKAAARLFLRVTDIKIERLQDIRYYEVFKEGIKSADVCNSKCHNALPCATKQAASECSVIDAFKALWNTTIKQSELDQYGWYANPWVLVYEFEVISKDEAYKLDA